MVHHQRSRRLERGARGAKGFFGVDVVIETNRTQPREQRMTVERAEGDHVVRARGRPEKRARVGNREVHARVAVRMQWVGHVAYRRNHRINLDRIDVLCAKLQQNGDIVACAGADHQGGVDAADVLIRARIRVTHHCYDGRLGSAVEVEHHLMEHAIDVELQRAGQVVRVHRDAVVGRPVLVVTFPRPVNRRERHGATSRERNGERPLARDKHYESQEGNREPCRRLGRHPAQEGERADSKEAAEQVGGIRGQRRELRHERPEQRSERHEKDAREREESDNGDDVRDVSREIARIVEPPEVFEPVCWDVDRRDRQQCDEACEHDQRGTGDPEKLAHIAAPEHPGAHSQERRNHHEVHVKREHVNVRRDVADQRELEEKN